MGPREARDQHYFSTRSRTRGANETTDANISLNQPLPGINSDWVKKKEYMRRRTYVNSTRKSKRPVFPKRCASAGPRRLKFRPATALQCLPLIIVRLRKFTGRIRAIWPARIW